MFKIKNTQTGESGQFETLQKVWQELMDYHADDLVEPDLPLDELCARFGWEIEEGGDNKMTNSNEWLDGVLLALEDYQHLNEKDLDLYNKIIKTIDENRNTPHLQEVENPLQSLHLEDMRELETYLNHALENMHSDSWKTEAFIEDALAKIRIVKRGA